MRRIARIGMAAAVLAGVLGVGRLALPSRTFACICEKPGPEEIGTFADEPTIVVFEGTVISASDADGLGGTGGRIDITRVYKGVLAARMTIIGGGGADCGLIFAAGQRLIAAAPIDRAIIHPTACMPHGDPATPEGQHLVAVAEAAYGPGIVPGEVRITPGDPFGLDASELGLALLATLVGLAAAALLFGLVIVLSRRGRRNTP